MTQIPIQLYVKEVSIMKNVRFNEEKYFKIKSLRVKPHYFYSAKKSSIDRFGRKNQAK